MCLILRRDSSGEYEGYTKSPDGKGFTSYSGQFHWLPHDDFTIRVLPADQTEWCILSYKIGARRAAYKGLVWTIDWHNLTPWPGPGGEAFTEPLDRGWGDLKDDDY